MNAADLFSLRGKRALVTGGAQGLGRMIAEGLLRFGAEVAITSRKAESLTEAAHVLGQLGTCLPLQADLSSPEAARELVRRYRDHWDSLHILVNNAGRTWGAPIDQFPDKAWPGIMAVNVQLPFTLVREFLPELSSSGNAHDPARVINIGSIAGSVVEPLHAFSYSASKAALHQLTRELAATLVERHITVNTIVPGYFATAMTAHMRDADGLPAADVRARIPLRRFGAEEDIAGAIAFLASRAGAYVTGTALHVDGGLVGCR